MDSRDKDFKDEAKELLESHGISGPGKEGDVFIKHSNGGIRYVEIKDIRLIK